jgi:hypothetical protein
LGKREDRNLSPPFSPVLLLYGKQKLSWIRNSNMQPYPPPPRKGMPCFLRFSNSGRGLDKRNNIKVSLYLLHHCEGMDRRWMENSMLWTWRSGIIQPCPLRLIIEIQARRELGFEIFVSLPEQFEAITSCHC